MSANDRGEIEALQRQAETLQNALRAVQDRLAVLARNQPTVTIERPPASWRMLLFVGAASSAATALFLGAGVLLLARSEPPRVTTETTPVTYVPAAPAPPPPPVVPGVILPPPPVALAPGAAVGSLTVVCLPLKCDQVIDNGFSLGPGHIFSRPVAAGRHQLLLSAPNGVRKTVTVEVLPDQLKDVRVSMSRDGSEVAPNFL